MEKIGAYPGRFQVFGLHHLDIVRHICHEYGLETLYILVADWALRTKENPLTATEAGQCIMHSLWGLDVATKIHVRPFQLTPDQAFATQFKAGLAKLRPKVVFSGSQSTLAATRLCACELGIEVVELFENPTACHSTDIRAWIAEGNGEWKRHVAPGAVTYLESLNLPERLKALEEGAKRPWAKLT